MMQYQQNCECGDGHLKWENCSVGQKPTCGKCGRGWVADRVAEMDSASALSATQQAIFRQNQQQSGGLISQRSEEDWRTAKDPMRVLLAENERLKKELASPRDGVPFEQHNAVQDDLKRLRAFSEDQASQIGKMEMALACRHSDLHAADNKIGELTRELDRARRGK